MINEVWKQINDYPNYFISNTGKVRNVKTGIEKVQTLKDPGYLIVTLYDNNKGKTFSVHRLVAQAFIDNPNNYDTVDHINGIKTDNRVDNLQWLSNSNNVKRFWEEQATKEWKENHKTVSRENIKKARKKFVEVHKIPIVCLDTGKVYESIKQASRELSLDSAGIIRTLKGEYKQTHGLHFKYLLEDNYYEE